MTDSLWRKRQEPERSMKVEVPLHVVCQCDQCKAQLEPVAWMSKDADIVYTSIQVEGCFQHDHIPLYTTPPQRKPLDRNKKLEIAELAAMKFEWLSDYIQAISFVVEQCEAAHGIKE